MSKRSSLQELAVYAQDVEAQFVAGLTPLERAAVGTPQDWSAKDLMGHLLTWREREAAQLEAVHYGPLPPEPEEFDETNRMIFEQTRGLSWDDVIRRAQLAWANLGRNLALLSEDQLAADPSSPPTGRPLWRRITVEAGNHPVMHYAEFARRRDRPSPATRWMEGAAPLLLAVDGSDEWGAVVHYNLACHYAQVGSLDEALDSLRTALDLNPGMAEWSTKDSDLARLHTDPRFKALTLPKR